MASNLSCAFDLARALNGCVTWIPSHGKAEDAQVALWNACADGLAVDGSLSHPDVPSLRATLQLRAQHLVDTVAIQLHMIKAVIR